MDSPTAEEEHGVSHMHSSSTESGPSDATQSNRLKYHANTEETSPEKNPSITLTSFARRRRARVAVAAPATGSDLDRLGSAPPLVRYSE